MKTFNQFLSEASDKERQAYFDRIYRQAKSSGDKFPELTAAQAATETGWGSSQSGKNNPFGQKASDSEKGTVRRTREVGSGGSYMTNAKFKDFDSEEDSTKNRVKTWSYKYGDAKDLETAARNLQLPQGAKIPGTKQVSHGVYATDPSYASTISSIAREYGPRSQALKNNTNLGFALSDRGVNLSKGSLDTPEPTRVLAKFKGKTGELDKSSGKFSNRDWSSAEGDRYKTYGGK
jgi:flagellum-specific peptidoglycan hydrolase FlgJ